MCAVVRMMGLAAFLGSFLGSKLVPSKWRYLIPPTSGYATKYARSRLHTVRHRLIMKNNIQEILKNCKWYTEPPASEAALEQLQQQSKLRLPTDYLDLLRYSNGGQGVLAVRPYLFRLWPAEEVIENNLDYEMPDYVPGFFGFGDNGGGEFFAF